MKTSRPVKVLQFGEGNFLRAFADCFIDIINEKTDFDGGIAIVKPISRGTLEKFHQQDCNYTVVLRGMTDGKIVDQRRKVTSVETVMCPYEEYEKYISYAECESLRFIISNTTEAGIVYSETDTVDMTPPESYPGKLTQFLYRRYCHFNGAPEKGLIMLPVELIEVNGDVLKDCVYKLAKRWQLPSGFTTWLDESCIFANTLVDRIVSGYPAQDAEKICEELGYEDQLLVAAEPFGLWVIEANSSVEKEICLDKVELPILFTDNHKPYKERKVRILNGAHTSFALMAYLCGKDYVKEALDDEVIKKYIETTIYEEIIPCLSLPESDSKEFAEAVLERFANPFVKHALLSISLNSVSKWKARCFPTFRDYFDKFGNLPANLTFSLATLIKFYRDGKRDGIPYDVVDDKEVLDFFKANNSLPNSELAAKYLSDEKLHGINLCQFTGLLDKVTEHLDSMDKSGAYEALKEHLHG